jgi:hypothetical protein
MAAVAGVDAMKRPEKVKLLGKKWTVLYKAALDNQHLTVKDGLKPEQEQSTLLHECIHAISDSLGLGLTEKQVQGLETGLYDLNSSNPRFFSYLKKKK